MSLSNQINVHIDIFKVDCIYSDFHSVLEMNVGSARANVTAEELLLLEAISYFKPFSSGRTIVRPSAGLTAHQDFISKPDGCWIAHIVFPVTAAVRLSAALMFF